MNKTHTPQTRKAPVIAPRTEVQPRFEQPYGNAAIAELIAANNAPKTNNKPPSNELKPTAFSPGGGFQCVGAGNEKFKVGVCTTPDTLDNAKEVITGGTPKKPNTGGVGFEIKF